MVVGFVEITSRTDVSVVSSVVVVVLEAVVSGINATK